MVLVKFQAIEKELNSRYIRRSREIRGLLLGVLANENILIIGPPGTAKSAMVEDFADMIGETYFSHLLTKFSTPEELFGPISYSNLKNDKYVHVPTGMLQEAGLAYIDEIFKANSGVLNSMLNVMNERVYKDAGKVMHLPLKSMIGTSNELMESEALNALFDRFLIRYNVDYLDPYGKTELIKSRRCPLPAIKAFVTNIDVLQAMAEIDAVIISDDVITKYIEIITFLNVNNRIETSDRRDVKVWGIFKAHAWLEGRSEVNVDDFDIMPDLMWRVPDERVEILRAVIEIAAPTRARVNGLLDAASELIRTTPAINNGKNITDDQRIAQLNGVLKQVKQMRKEMEEIAKNNKSPFVADAMLKMNVCVKQVGGILGKFIGVSL